MSYSEILDTQGRYRVRLVLDEDAGKPYNDGASPLLRINSGARATHVMATGRPLDEDETVEQAISYWHTTPGDSGWRRLERYLRAFHGVTQIETWHSGSYWYVTYDSAAWRAYAGAPPGSADMSEYRAWCEGDVWGWVVEKLVLWTTADGAVSPAFKDKWEHVNSCWGYYGSDGANGEYLKQCAREALAYENEPYAHMAGAHEIRPDLLARWDREAVTRKHAGYHQLNAANHAHGDPAAPFAVTIRCKHCGASCTADGHGTLTDQAGGDVYTEHGDDLPHEPAAPGTGDDTLTPVRLAAAIADMQRVQRNLEADRNARNQED